MTFTLFRLFHWSSVVSPASPVVAQDCGEVAPAGLESSEFCPGVGVKTIVCRASVDAYYNVRGIFRYINPSKGIHNSPRHWACEKV